MSVRIRSIFIACLVSAAAVSTAGQVTNTYVAASGNDANPCTIAQPCATVTRGVNAVDPNGKVLIIENGDYAQFSIFKPVTVAAADGVHATINGTAGFAIFNNNLQPGDVIAIRNLHLVALNPNVSGISNFLGQTMFVDNCTFSGFSSAINSLNAGRTYVTNSTFRKNVNGVTAGGPQPPEEGLARVTIDSCIFEANDNGIAAFSKVLMNVRNSTIAGNTLNGIWIRPTIANTLTEVIVDGSQINHNTVGVLAAGLNGAIAAVNLSRSTLTRNRQAGISLQGIGYAYTFGNNTFFGNNPDVSGGNLQLMQSK